MLIPFKENEKKLLFILFAAKYFKIYFSFCYICKRGFYFKVHKLEGTIDSTKLLEGSGEFVRELSHTRFVNLSFNLSGFSLLLFLYTKQNFSDFCTKFYCNFLIYFVL